MELTVLDINPTSELTTNDGDDKEMQFNPALLYLKSLNSEKSKQKMQYLINIVAKMIGAEDYLKCDWTKLRRTHVMFILEDLEKKGLSPSRINTYLSAMKGISYESYVLDYIGESDFKHIKTMKNFNGERIPKGRVLSTVEIKKIFKETKVGNTSKSLRDTSIVSVLLGCGLRRSELVNLRIKDVSWKNNTIKVLGKGNKERLASMPDWTSSDLHAWIEEARGGEDLDGYIYTRVRSGDDVTTQGLTDQAIYKLTKDIGFKAFIDDFSPHDFRRTFANMLIDANVNISVIAAMMGHSSITTTQLYIRTKQKDIETASRLLKI